MLFKLKYTKKISVFSNKFLHSNLNEQYLMKIIKKLKVVNKVTKLKQIKNNIQ